MNEQRPEFLKLGADLIAIVKRVDELSQTYDLQTDGGRNALATEIRMLGCVARNVLALNRSIAKERA